MTPQERSDKLDKIYDVIGPKGWNNIQDELNSLNESNCIGYSTYSDLFDMAVSKIYIGDCLDWMEERMIGPFEILLKWKSKRLPIDDQSDECVTYIFNLLPNE